MGDQDMLKMQQEKKWGTAYEENKKGNEFASGKLADDGRV